MSSLNKVPQFSCLWKYWGNLTLADRQLLLPWFSSVAAITQTPDPNPTDRKVWWCASILSVAGRRGAVARFITLTAGRKTVFTANTDYLR